MRARADVAGTGLTNNYGLIPRGRALVKSLLNTRQRLMSAEGFYCDQHLRLCQTYDRRELRFA